MHPGGGKLVEHGRSSLFQPHHLPRKKMFKMHFSKSCEVFKKGYDDFDPASLSRSVPGYPSQIKG